MSPENKIAIFQPDPQEGRIARTKRSFLEKIPFTSSYVKKIFRETDLEREMCAQAIMTDIEEKGLIGAHKLEALPIAQRGTFAHIKGEMEGSLFLLFGRIRGEIEGETRTVSSIQFAWRTNNRAKEFLVSEIPVDEFVFEFDDESEDPTVEFEFNPYELMRYRGWQGFVRSVFPHPNDYLKQKYLNRVTLTLSREMYRSLPFPGASSEKESSQES